MPTDPAPGGALSSALRGAGHAVRACGWCGAVLAADVDHQGNALPNRSRRYCDAGHRVEAARARRGVTPDGRAQNHARRHHDLLAHLAQESAGQLALPVAALPAVPPLET